MNSLSKTLSPSSVGLAVLMLGQIVRIAIDEDLIAKDPMRRLKLPKKAPKRERELPVERAVELLSAVKGTPLSAPIFLAVVLGLRRGEICGLKWEDLDRRAKTLRIRRQRQDMKGKLGVRELPPKAGSTRTYYLNQGIVDELDSRGDLDSPYVCTCGGMEWRPDALTRWFNSHKEGLGLPPDWTLHDLRHLNGALLNAAGVQLTGIAPWLGHSTTAQSEQYVTHGAELKRADAQRLSKLLGLEV